MWTMAAAVPTVARFIGISENASVEYYPSTGAIAIFSDCQSSKAIRLALEVTEAIAYSHSCLNPILYVFVGEKFRRHLFRLINKAPCRLCKMVKVCIPQDRITGSVYSQTTSLDERSTAV
ncbi:CX3C chemokine receptor 1 [Dissostichus eleginoides]|uniref:CX3C chemokine receptor 1 n=1 Tax=Dissostichus eleginoides TaxID=100907 RepID=A0AAD9C770_DISEL|nr:CX3C chemokine receptor 1 [Dissostichus eleginoides]